MISKSTKTIIFTVSLLISFILGSMLAATSVQNTWRLDAAKTECAQFNPMHGQFEWLSEGVHENANLR